MIARGDTDELDPQLAEICTILHEVTHANLNTAHGKMAATDLHASFHADAPVDVTACDIQVPGPHGPIPVRVYRSRAQDEPRAVLVWLHGGGWVDGDLDMPEADHASRFVCAEADIVVVSVDYRLAVGGVHFPVPNDDVVAAFHWVIAQAEQLDIDPQRVLLGGASAGGNLAAGVALRLRDSGGHVPAGLVLVYPLVHAELPPLTAATQGQLAVLPPVLRFPPEVAGQVVANFLGGHPPEANGYAFAAIGTLDGLPPTMVLVSEYDDLRTSGEAFAEALLAAGVSVELVCEPDVPHGHLNLPRLEGSTRSLRRISSWIRSQSSSPRMSHDHAVEESA